MSVTENLLTDFLTQDDGAAQLKVCERRAEGIILPKIREFLPSTSFHGCETTSPALNKGRQMSVTENLLADFLTQEEAAAELKVCQRRSAGIILPKIREFLPFACSGGCASQSPDFIMRRQMSATEKLSAGFPTQEEAPDELKVCTRRAAGITLPKNREFLPSTSFHGCETTSPALNEGRQMSVTENLLADFLEQDEAAAELKVCRRTLDRWRALSEGPPITKLGRRILYRRSSLQAWLRAREHHGNIDDSLGVRRAQLTPHHSNHR